VVAHEESDQSGEEPELQDTKMAVELHQRLERSKGLTAHQSKEHWSDKKCQAKETHALERGGGEKQRRT